MIQLPPELENYWPNRGYYGSLRHNARAVYQRYMGKALLRDTYEQLGYQAESGQDRCFEARGRCYRGGLGAVHRRGQRLRLRQSDGRPGCGASTIHRSCLGGARRL